MSRYFINILFLLFFGYISAQEQPKDSLTNVHTKFKLNPLNLRIGFDIGNYLTGIVNSENKTGFYLDSNIYKNYFLTILFGKETDNFNNGLLNVRTQGTYFKTGIDYNIYDNWPGMDNQVSVGFYYGYSNFDAFLYDYVINQPASIFQPQPVVVNRNFYFSNNSWLELTGKLQVETLKNLYLGYTISLKYLLTSKRTDEFEAIYIPGFYKVNSHSNFGFGMQYFISYRFKIKKTAKK